MWGNVRVTLWAHSLASWAAFGGMWLETLLSTNAALDERFWLIFSVTQGLAPVYLPGSIVVALWYDPASLFGKAMAILVAVYVPVAIVTFVWRWRREQRRLRARRRDAGQCVRCGYDVHATPARCPECGAVPDTPLDAPPQPAAAA